MRPSKEQEPIAIIGTGCRLPGKTTSLGRLWDMISHGKSGHDKVPPSRWDADTWYHPDPDRKGSISVKHGYFLDEDISLFDAPFFSMTAKEAAGMDPMKRLLLEVSFEGFENAGIPVDTLMNSQTGVYVGCMTNDYEQLSTHEIYDVGDVAASGLSEAMIANRVSWFFGLRGPSLTLDTACSSSLYALHLACQSLKLGEINMGLVAGVNLILHPNFMHQLSSMHMLSPEGLSHSFDHRANGYGRGEGVGCLIVKRLRDALRDGDTIRAIIRGTGVNADGKTPGITQPSSDAQAELIRSTYSSAGLSFADTQYFEAHGTGTPLGDPIELSAIGATIGAGRTAESGPLYVGSIKANVGHTEGCSGLAGVLKSILCLEKGILVPTAGIEKPNPKLKLSDWNLALPTENMAWPTKGQRRISVNSFGFGGANAHVILDDAYNYLRSHNLSGNHKTSTYEDDSSESGISIGSDSPREDASKRLFVFSAKDQNGIERFVPLYVDLFSNKEATSSPRFISDIAYTLSARRSHFEYRSFAIAESVSDLQQQMSKGLLKFKRAAKHDNPIFIFTGQGAQWPAMGRELLNNNVFRDSIHKSQALLEHYGCPWDLVDELSKTSDSNVDLPQYSQVLCTVLQIALVDLLRYWGVTPKAVVGHSSGEIGAAYAAGLLSRCNAVKIAYLRGVCSAKVAGIVSPQVGAMLAAGLSEKDAEIYLAQIPHRSAVVACVNSPSSVTLSGDYSSISKLCELISADGKFTRMLRVQTAYHSPHMENVAQEYFDRMGVIIPLCQQDQVAPMFSSVTGKPVSSGDLDGNYWMRNMCEQVRFSQAMSNLLELATDASRGRGHGRTAWSAFIEIGPHGALQSPVAEIVKSSQSKAAKEAPYLSAITRQKDAEMTTMQLAGQLWASGHGVQLSKVNGLSSEPPPVALPDIPSYPWNHNKGYWHESAATRSNRFPSSPRTDLLGVPVDLQNPMEPRWRNFLRISENPWIEDHKITATMLYPAAGMIVMAIEAARQLIDSKYTPKGIILQNLKFERGLVIPSRDQAVQTEISLRPGETSPDTWDFAVYSTSTTGSWTRNCHGSLTLAYDEKYRMDSEKEWDSLISTWKEVTTKTSKDIDIDSLYNDLEAVGIEYGPTFRNVFQAAANPGEYCAYGSVRIPDTKSSMPSNFEYPHLIHPATMDAIFHLLFIAFSDGKPLKEAAVPYTLEQMYISTDLPQGEGSVYTGFAKRLRINGRETAGDLVVSDEAWNSPKLVVRNFALRQVTSLQDSPSTNEGTASKVSAKIQWKEDFEFIRATETLLRSNTERWVQEAFRETAILSVLFPFLEILYHKLRNYEALIVVTDATKISQQMLQNLLLLFESTKDSEDKSPFQVSLVAATEEVRELTESLLLNSRLSVGIKMWHIHDKKLPFSGQTFDLVLILDASGHTMRDFSALSHLCELTRSNGHLGVLGLSLVSPEEERKVQEVLASSGLITWANERQQGTRETLLLAHKRTATDNLKMPEDVYIIQPIQPSKQSLALVKKLLDNLRMLGCQPHLTTLDDVDQLQGGYVISLLEAESPFVSGWTEEEFTRFKHLVSRVKHLLWITRGGLMRNWDGGLQFAPSQGLLRVMRTEYSQITLPHLDLSREIDLGSESTVNVIMDIWLSSTQSASQLMELEYAEMNGTIYVPRFVEDKGIDTDLAPSGENLKPIKGALRRADPHALVQDNGCFVWIENHEGCAPLRKQEIQVEVEYAALKIDAAEDSGGQPKGMISTSAVGVVAATSREVVNFQAGQRVMTLQSGPCRTRVQVHESFVRQLPQELGYQEALSTIPALVAAQYALLEVARVECGQMVIIHGVDSPIGQVAVQLATLVGAEVYAVPSGSSSKQEICQKLRLCEDRVFEYISSDCRTAIMQHTNGLGADVVLCCGKTSSSAAFECLSEFGVFVDFRGYFNPGLTRTDINRNVTVLRADPSRLFQAKPALAKRLFHEAFDMVENGRIMPITPCEVAAVSELSNPRSKNSARELILRFDYDSSVLIRPSRPAELQLDSEATYVLAGGLGALGLRIAEMMFRHGAGHVVFLSRSGGEKNLRDLDSFRERGLEVDAFKCDISNASQVECAVQGLVDQGRNIKGVVQCAMVLEDAIFENMTYDQWQKTTKPKIQGTMNLHNFMPTNVDFFILLSSITCVIGNAAQSNYSAGNTFEDAFAHYRQSQDLAATAIDVGLVTDSAHFTGDFDMEAYLQMYEHRWDGLQTTQKELDVVIRAAMRGRTADGQPIEPQIVLGLGSSMPCGPSAVSWTRDGKFNHRVNHDSSSVSGITAHQPPAAERIAQAQTFADAVLVFEQVLKTYAAQAMDVAPDDVDAEKSFYDFGVDSLKAVELRNHIFRDLQSDMSVFELLSPSPLSKLASEIAKKSKLTRHVVDRGGGEGQ
ncbi:highly reducing polyketide synthase curS1 [Colletotrichum spaethianum]|uniref:Highly reducing polyketide synthase curS1 n=1 Tax=Colletotrichum spaethianum TaxID=700344 RepID=A0AA37PCA9_9PEZI|nr:highly reducing polyketide synthase curS1 [Colletotrichum spaethianum]GKT49640.1 highly reducing polyketide synthase curS1 [Colletotrichum spaethianum]